ncbi:MAG: EAL domain-containing protein [Gammaproteobacteria bacterium]|nr:EAL domain-containing protein [Gammaproteobacteria bacterium]
MPIMQSLTAKIFIAGLVSSLAYIVGITLLSYFFIEKNMHKVYLDKAHIVARSLGTTIESRSDLSQPAMLGQIEKHLKLDPDVQSITVFTKQFGVLVSTISNLQGPTGIPASGNNLQAFNENQVVKRFLIENDMPLLRVFSPIQLAGQSIGTLKIDLKLESFNQLRRNYLISIILGLIVINALILLGFILYVKLRVAEPAHQLLANVKKITRGEFDVRVPITSRDELGMLSEDFNKMALSLEQQRQEIISANENIEYQATHDMLTGLPNRYSFQERIRQNVVTSKRHLRRGVMMMMDLDQFKAVNDSMGHHAGDELLIQVADRLNRVIREEDMLARLGGDEFIILISEVSNDEEKALSQVQTILSGILDSFTEPFLLNDEEVKISASIGVVFYPDQGEDVEELLKHADTAMYKAKEDGGNCSRLFDANMQQKLSRRVGVLKNLRNGIQQEQLKLFYQPQVDAKGKLMSAEALVRWIHPHKGIIQPHDFIDVAENNDIIIELGEWVISSVCEQLQHWRASKSVRQLVPISVNMSSKQFHQDNFCDLVIDNLEKFDISPHYLTLEITENVLLKKFQDTREKIQKLKQFGVRFSVDDFGTGFSSLAYLKQLPLDEVKIDRSFVRDMMTDSKDEHLVNGIINLSHTLDLNVVAEGVENQMQFDILIAKHCELFQGFLFDQPLTADQFEKYLN